MRLPFANIFGYYPTLQQFNSIWMCFYVWPKCQVGEFFLLFLPVSFLLLCVSFSDESAGNMASVLFFLFQFSLISKQPDVNNDWVTKANKPIWLMKFSPFFLFGNIDDLWPLRKKKTHSESILMFFLFVALLSRDFVPHSVATYNPLLKIFAQNWRKKKTALFMLNPNQRNPLFCNKEIKKSEIKQTNLRGSNWLRLTLFMFVYKMISKQFIIRCWALFEVKK